MHSLYLTYLIFVFKPFYYHFTIITALEKEVALNLNFQGYFVSNLVDIGPVVLGEKIKVVNKF